MRKYLFILAAIMMASVAMHAQPKSVPVLLNYQGYLAVAADTLPYSGTVDMTFSLFAAPAGGSALWTETQNNVAITKGFFNALLGGVTPLPPALFDGSIRYLECTANGQTFAPRKPLVSVGYAVRSLQADSAQFALVSSLADHAYTSDSADSAGYASSAPVGAHNHIGQRWSANPGSLGLSLRLDAASGSAVYGYVDTVYNSGTGTANGIAANVYGNSATGLRRAVYGLADNGGAGAAYAGDFQTNSSSFGTGQRRAVNAYAQLNYDGGPVFGVYSYAYCPDPYAGQMFGGWFRAEGGTAGASKYGVYATAVGSGTNFAGYFDGNLATTGKLTFAATYTPVSSADANGTVGDISYDANYVYIKTASGWRRAALSSW